MYRSPDLLSWWWEWSTTNYFIVFNLKSNHELIPDSSVSRLTLMLAVLPPRSCDPHGSHFNFYHPDWIWAADLHSVHQNISVPCRHSSSSQTEYLQLDSDGRVLSLVQTHDSGSGFVSSTLFFLDSSVWTGQNDAVTGNWKSNQSDRIRVLSHFIPRQGSVVSSAEPPSLLLTILMFCWTNSQWGASMSSIISAVQTNEVWDRCSCSDPVRLDPRVLWQV